MLYMANLNRLLLVIVAPDVDLGLVKFESFKVYYL